MDWFNLPKRKILVHLVRRLIRRRACGSVVHNSTLKKAMLPNRVNITSGSDFCLSSRQKHTKFGISFCKKISWQSSSLGFKISHQSVSSAFSSKSKFFFHLTLPLSFGHQWVRIFGNVKAFCTFAHTHKHSFHRWCRLLQQKPSKYKE